MLKKYVQRKFDSHHLLTSCVCFVPQLYIRLENANKNTILIHH